MTHEIKLLGENRQRHQWLAILTAVAAEKCCKDDVIACRVCFVSGKIADPMLMKNRDDVVSLWAWGFMLVEERMVWRSHVFVLKCFAYDCLAWALKPSQIHSLDSNRTPEVLLRIRPWRGLTNIAGFKSGWGFVSGSRVLAKWPFVESSVTPKEDK